jgi:hypothetical protein
MMRVESFALATPVASGASQDPLRTRNSRQNRMNGPDLHPSTPKLVLVHFHALQDRNYVSIGSCGTVVRRIHGAIHTPYNA